MKNFLISCLFVACVVAVAYAAAWFNVTASMPHQTFTVAQFGLPTLPLMG